MEQIEQPAALYDFLYRDSNRIASYYSQIFHGHLSSMEKNVSERRNVDVSGKLDFHVVSGDRKITTETLEGDKRIFDPHDLIATDVLSFLVTNDHALDDITNAPHGSLVVVQGTLVFVDRLIAEVAIIAFDNLISTHSAKPKSPEEKANLQGLKVLKDALQKISLPSAFILQTNEGIQIVGTIKEAGMEEAISNYYFKHGTAGLSDVYMIGIKEVPSPAFALPDTQLIGAGQQMAQALSDMLFPAEAIRVTPIALFRRLF
jgi:hypothetical protein